MFKVLYFISFLFILFACSGPEEAKESSPNIILIMADDIGIDGFGCYGGTSFETPNLDKMAHQGIRFTHAYSQPLCTPTRVEIMTGKYNHRNWKYFGVLDPGEKTFGHLMSLAGYRTCIAGKWQLYSYDPPGFPGAGKRRGTGMHPKDAGFEEYSLFHSLHTEDKGSRYANPTFLKNGKLHENVEGAYGEDLSVEFIGDFLEKHREEPVFVYYPMALPHGPLVPTPLSEDWKNPEMRLNSDFKYYPDMVKYMDVLIGKLVTKVEELGLAEKTLFLFYSDNGSHLGITSYMGETPVPGGKGMVSQTGIRVPLIAYWPGTITPGVSRDLVDATDFMPTLADLADFVIPESWNCEGISFAPGLLGYSGEKREHVFFWYDPRPGWDKEQFSRKIFALDHQFKLFSDGRMYDIGGLFPLEMELDLTRLSQEAQEARKRLGKVIEDMMKPPLSEAAVADPEEYGE